MEKSEDFVLEFKNVNYNIQFYMLFNGKTKPMSHSEYKSYVMLFSIYDISLLQSLKDLYNKHDYICKSKIFINNYKINAFYQGILTTSVNSSLVNITSQFWKAEHNLDFFHYDSDIKISILNELLKNNFNLLYNEIFIEHITYIEYEYSGSILIETNNVIIRFYKKQTHIYDMMVTYNMNSYGREVDLGIYNRDRKLKEIDIID